MTARRLPPKRTLPLFCHKIANDLLVLYVLLPKLSVEERKPLLTLCRVQSQVEHNTRLMTEIRPFLGQVYLYRESAMFGKIPRVTTYFDLASTVSKYRDSPIAISFISCIIRCAPYESPESAIRAKQAGIDKELSAAQHSEKMFSVNVYDSIFPPDEPDGSELHLSWNVHLPSRPFVNLKIRRGLEMFRNLCSKGVFLPRFQANKTVSRESAREYMMCTLGEIPQDDDGSVSYDVTSGDLLKHYHETGHKIGGPCEVRVAWKYNDLKPRVYYAQGGDAFFSSLYIQQIANILVRQFASTHTKTRYSLTRLTPNDPLNEFRHFMLHDYASFTSQMEEVRYFIRELANSCFGVPLTVIDPRKGVLTLDLGDYLHQYVDTNLDHPLFSLERLTGSPEDILEHRRAGMLGVYGNIALCTFLHGVYLAQISGGFDSSTTVGDDGAHFVDTGMSTEDSVRALQEIGEINQERFIIFDNIEVGLPRDQSWHFIKRPVRLIDGFIETGFLLEFPLLASVFEEGDISHTVSFGTLHERRRNFCLQVARYLDHLPSLKSYLDDPDRILLYHVLNNCYQYLGLPKSGSIPPHRSLKGFSDFPYTIPPICEQVYEINWLDYLLGDNEQDTIRFPLVYSDLDVPENRSLMSDPIGEPYMTELQPGMAMLEYFGFITTKMIVREQIRTPFVDSLFKDFIRGSRKPLYDLMIIRRPPSWFAVVETFLWHMS